MFCRRKAAARRGGLAEWPIALVLKTSWGQPLGGSNPPPSAMTMSACLPTTDAAIRIF